MARFEIDAGLAETAVASRRFEALSKLNLDVSTIATWDRGLSRRTRILVPIDVQAYVVPASGTEATVDVVGDPDTDPAPFAPGSVRPAGVHLHWAMPDALLAAQRADPAVKTPVLPALPDQWVVVRTLQPVGHQQVLATGWVIDARTTVVTPLPAFTGPVPPPEGAVDPVHGFSLGVHWTSSYSSSAGRFAFHDPLADLDQLRTIATQGFDGDQAVYTVAGWWSDSAADPVSGARGIAGLDAVLARLRWDIDHDLRDTYVEERDTREVRTEVEAGLARPRDHAVTELYGSDGRRIEGVLGTDLISGSPFLDPVRTSVGDSLPRYDSLLHGSVLGVPIGAVPVGADDRPDPADLTVAVGSDVDDVIAAMGAAGVGLGDEQRRAAEDLLAAFSHGLVAELGTPDGLDYLGHREHESGFWSLPGTPVPAMQPDVIQDQVAQGADPLTVGRHGRAGMSRASGGKGLGTPSLVWKQKADLINLVQRPGAAATTTANPKVGDVVDEPPPSSLREVLKAPPRYFRPAPLVVAIRGGKPSHRHHGDGLFTSEGRLMCRYPRAAVPRYRGLVEGSRVLPTLGSGSVPAEVLTVAREAVLLNPYGRSWLAAASAPSDGGAAAAARTRLDAEMVRLYGVEGTYDGTSHVAFVEPKAAKAWDQVSTHRIALEHEISAVIAEAAIAEGQPPSPVAITTWRQPWVPLWLEWRVTVTGTTTLRGWELVGLDLEPDPEAAAEPEITRELTGRGLVGKGVGETLRAAVQAWLASEAQRQATPGRTSYGQGSAVQRLADLDHPLDLLSASLDGLREQLLGIDFVGVVKRADGKPVASALPVPLLGGTVRVDDLRIIDAFGRFVDVPHTVLDGLLTTLELEVEGEARTLRLRPRLQNAARWLWRLVDPGQAADTPPELVKEAFVNQVAPSAAVNPVSGFLLPDHIDEALEAFTVAGQPIGQVLHDPVTYAVSWECAPGRPVPPDAGPLVGTAAQERIVAEIAAGMIRADAAARDLPEPPLDTALTAFLRAVDSTLWSIDTFASLGDSTLAGLVGRPIAVVRTILTLDAPDDVGELTLEGHTDAAREAAFDVLAEEAFEAQLGTLGRADDTLLGFFLDDDYETFFIVDKVVAELARLRPTGRHLGHLGVLGAPAAEDPLDLEHPYLSAANRVVMRRGQTRRLTLLMIPGGRVHLTSGLLPRKELALADAWFTPGLKKLMPSLRVGPLLVDPGEVRLPLVSILGENQTFTRRTGELTWKDDPILAATQTAYLPRLPHEVQEGWIRVTPTEEGET